MAFVFRRGRPTTSENCHILWLGTFDPCLLNDHWPMTSKPFVGLGLALGKRLGLRLLTVDPSWELWPNVTKLRLITTGDIIERMNVEDVYIHSR